MFYRTGVIAYQTLTLQKYGFSTFFAPVSDLDLDQMTFICELDPLRYTGCEKMNSYVGAFESYRITDRHT